MLQKVEEKSRLFQIKMVGFVKGSVCKIFYHLVVRMHIANKSVLRFVLYSVVPVAMLSG